MIAIKVKLKMFLYLLFFFSYVTQIIPEVRKVPQQYGTIQLAIDASNSGDTVLIANGQYNENLIIKKSLSLVGTNSDSTFILSTSSIDAITIDSTKEVSITNMKVYGFSAGYFQNGGNSISITNSTNITFTAVNIFGGNGGNALCALQHSSPARDGGNAVNVNNSKNITFQDCILKKGSGGTTNSMDSHCDPHIASDGCSVWAINNSLVDIYNPLSPLAINHDSSSSVFTHLPQNSEWLKFTVGGTVDAIALEGDIVWAGTYSSGLVRMNKGTGEKTIFNTSNSGLPSDEIKSIAIDGNGDKWIGTYNHGIAKFDGTNWGVFKTSNSKLPSDLVTSLAIDARGNKWIGTRAGLAKFDGITWTVYNTSNSGIPSNNVSCLVIDKNGNKWFSANGLVKFDDTSWTAYSSSGFRDLAIDEGGNKWTLSGNLARFDGTNWSSWSGLPGHQFFSLAIDINGAKWIATDAGVAKFDNTNWTIFTTTNSILPSDWIMSIITDSYGNKWIGTSGAIVEYKEGGIVAVKEESKKNSPTDFSLSQNYPNPFNPSTTISFTIPSSQMVELKVYDMLGREIAELINEYRQAGSYSAQFNASHLSTGIYFYKLKAGNFVQTKKLILLK
ncbi:MAG: T9SS type A sorting domain-containing protein [Ignavibacteriaceae bacterium]|jgi:hypothetical protein